MSEADSKFELLTASDTQKLLAEAVSSLASAMIWTKLQETVVHTNILIISHSDQTMYLGIPEAFDQRKWVEEIARSGTRDCYLSVSLNRANIFFHASFVGYETGIKFKLPDQVFKVLRRNDLRYVIPAAYTLKATLTDPSNPTQKTTKKIIDLSKSGLALFIEEEEASVFPPKLEIPELSFTITQRLISCQAEVRHITPYNGGNQKKGQKIGLLFKNLALADSRLLGEYTTQESRSQFEKLLRK